MNTLFRIVCLASFWSLVTISGLISFYFGAMFLFLTHNPEVKG